MTQNNLTYYYYFFFPLLGFLPSHRSQFRQKGILTLGFVLALNRTAEVRARTAGCLWFRGGDRGSITQAILRVNCARTLLELILPSAHVIIKKRGFLKKETKPPDTKQLVSVLSGFVSALG